MIRAIALLLGAALLPVANAHANNVIGERQGSLDWNGWVLNYDTFTYDDGLILEDVSYNGLNILARLSFPVMSVFYDGPCGPYADRLNGPQYAVGWANNATLVAREFTQEGRQWFELGIREFIGSYDIYQAYYFSEDGELDAHIFSRGMQCDYYHVHHPMWLMDFDLDGAGSDQILREEITGQLTPMLTEFQTAATDAFQHGWYVQDSITGARVSIGFDDGNWNVGSAVTPETEYLNNNIGGMVARESEYEWVRGASENFPFVNGESLEGNDIVVWYKGYMPHWPEEGAELWHSTGVRLLSNNALDTDGDGIPDAQDDDDDNDGIPDSLDDLPKNPNESVDTDADGIGNNADDDDDNDQVLDVNDAFPLDAYEWLDTDGDGTGDNADIDADNDGITDFAESGSDDPILIIDDFENGTLFTVNPDGNDSATTGRWEQGDPDNTSSGTVELQLGIASNGSGALVTGLDGGLSAGANDVDGGTTSARSAAFEVPSNAEKLLIDWFVGHLTNGDGNDGLRVVLESASGDIDIVNYGVTGNDRSATWQTAEIDVSALRGQSVTLYLAATDNANGSLIEAGVDYLRFEVRTGLDSDGDGIDNSLDLDSDNDTIPDILEAGLEDLDGDYRVDAPSFEGAVGTPPDSDGDTLPDFLDPESGNAANDGTAFDIAATPFAVLDGNGDGRLDASDGHADDNGNGLADTVEGYVPPDDCGDPVITPAADNALYAWLDCDGRVQIVAVSGESGSSSYNGLVVNDGGLGDLELNSIESSDAVALGDTQIEFDLTVGGPYTDAFSSLPLADGDTCVGLLDQSVGTRLLGGKNAQLMSGPFNPATLESCALPAGSACGSPNVDPATEEGVWVWKDCDGTWKLMLTGLGDAGGVDIVGEILGTDLAFTPETLESSDVLGVSADIGTFQLATVSPWNDRFNFTTSDEASLCVTVLNNGAGIPIYAGSDRIEQHSSFNPLTLAACEASGNNCTAPDFSADRERGLFIWLDCEGMVNIVGTGGISSASYSGHLYSDTPVASVGTRSYEASDTLIDSDLSALYFDMTMGGQWTDQIMVTPTSEAMCLAIESQSDDTALYYGSSRTVVSSPFNPINGEPCTPPATADCGNAPIDATVDSGLYVWKSCDGTWNLQITGPGDGQGLSGYIGTVSTSTAFTSLTPQTVEASDTLTQTDATLIDFDLRTSTPWEDRFTFTVNEGDEICVSVSELPATGGVFAGTTLTAVPSSFNPVTLEACN